MAASLRPSQIADLAFMFANERFLLLHDPGVGKASALTAKVLTPSGWRLMDDIAVGDEVITGDGSITRVVGVYPQGVKDIYRVTFSDGSATECCNEHLWLTQTKLDRNSHNGAFKVRSLAEIRETLRYQTLPNHMIPMVGAVQFPERPVLLDPYLLGALIGDGALCGTSPAIINPDKEVIDYVRAALPEGVTLKLAHRNKKESMQWYLVRQRKRTNTNLVTKALTDLGLRVKSVEKRLPELYLFNAPHIRIALLQGLMDTDGHVSKSGHSVQFSTSSSGLAEDVRALVQSLGGVVRTRSTVSTYPYKGENRLGNPVFRLQICLPPHIAPFRLSRKAERVVPKTKYGPARYIDTVELVGPAEAQCIAVEHPSQLYITDDFIVTHNTPPVCVWAAWVTQQAEKVVWVMPRSLLKKNRVELLRFTNLTEDDIKIVDSSTVPTTGKVFLLGPDRFRLVWNDLLTAHPTINALAADELHLYWSTNKSKRTQAWYQAMRHIKRFVGMTGTLINGRLDSAYPAIQVIEPRYYGTHANFLREHAVTDDFGTVLAWKNPEKISAIIAKHAIRRTFAAEYGPEAKVIVTELASMSEKQREAYDEFAALALLELEDSFLESPNGGVHALRCRQIMAHPETFGIGSGEPTGKDELLSIHLHDHANTKAPLLIFAAFLPEQRRILGMCKQLGMTVEVMNGEATAKQRALMDERFRARQTQVLICSPQVAGVGFNWEHVDHIVFTTLDYMSSTFVQGYRRAIRGVRTTPLRITVLEYENSLDQRVMQIIKRKSQLASTVDGGATEVFDLSTAA